jgi:hypothetical protein
MEIKNDNPFQRSFKCSSCFCYTTICASFIVRLLIKTLLSHSSKIIGCETMNGCCSKIQMAYYFLPVLCFWTLPSWEMKFANLHNKVHCVVTKHTWIKQEALMNGLVKHDLQCWKFLNSGCCIKHVHKVSFPLVPQLANLILSEATARTW